MDYSHQAQTSHYAAPPTYYHPPPATAAIISAPPNPNPSSDPVPVEVPLSVQPGVDASLASLAGHAVPYYQAAAYSSYEASVACSAASAAGAGVVNAYIGYMPTLGPSRQVKKKKASHVVTAEALEAKKQKLIDTGANVNFVRTCTICNVVCNSDVVFASHIASEKHISRVNGNPSKGLAMYTSHVAARPKLNKKFKMKKTNALVAVRAPTVVQSVYCDICKITCNTQEIYNTHVSGKKHNKNIKNHVAGDGLSEKFVPARGSSLGTQAPCTNDNEKKSVYCDVCKVKCDTLEMYNNHVSGKKHNKNIKKLTMGDKSIQFATTTSTSPGIQAPATNDNDQEHEPSSSQMPPKPDLKSNSVLKEDLETKKKKMLESGANGDAVKVCELCNIVCNSPKVFEYHCEGQKHRNMVKKQEENLGDPVKVCDLCNIVCNSPKVFENHCQGQKHRSMVKKQEENLGGSAVAHCAEAPGVVSAQMTAAPS